MKRRRRTIWGGAILALAVAAIVVPAAQARPTPMYTTAGYGAPGAIGTAPATSERSGGQSTTAGSYRTGEYGAPSAVGLGPQENESGQSTTSGSYKTGAYGAPSIIGLGPKVAESTSQPVTTTSSDGFAWKSFGIGAGIALLALGLTSALLLSRRRQAHVAV